MRSSMRILVLALAALAALGAGCAQKDSGLTLRYAPVGRDVGECKAAVGVGQIRDGRGGMKAIGDRDQTVKYYPLGPAVTDWVHEALVVEFKARGCEAAAYSPGSPFSADWVVNGEVLSTYLSQTGMLGSKLHLKMRFFLDRALDASGRHVFQKTYEGTWERTALNFSQERNEALFQEALGDLLRDVVPELAAHMR
ncbi:MAG: hypothetical protein AB1916_02350 [Thermodesulfobacteriota bacterium]